MIRKILDALTLNLQGISLWKNLIELIGRIQKAGADIQIVDQGIDTRTPASELIFRIFAAVIRERTIDGLRAARARGHLDGLSKTYTPQQARWPGCSTNRVEMTALQIAGLLGVSRTTYFHMLDNLQVTT
jgi:DNA invertase Pin-like site-specific DNA recombinase